MADDVGTVAAAELDEALRAERAKKATVEAKGLSVITTSGVLVTLLFGLLTVATGKQETAAGAVPAGFLLAGMALFTAASILGIVCNAPRRYLELDATTLTSMTEPGVWSTDGTEARRELALARVRIVANWQRVNHSMAKVLVAAIAVEVAGITAVAVAAILVALRVVR